MYSIIPSDALVTRLLRAVEAMLALLMSSVLGKDFRLFILNKLIYVPFLYEYKLIHTYQSN